MAVDIRKIEIVVIVTLLLLLIVWLVPRCGGGNKNSVNTPVDSLATQSTPQQTNEQTQNTSIANTGVGKVFASADTLNVRAQPYLNSPVIDRIMRGNEMFFIGQKSDFKQKIRLEGIDYNEPWVKIRTQEGKEGWVFGGGVRFYK